MISIAAYIKSKIEKTQPGQILCYRDFKVEMSQQMAMAKELSRLTSKGVLVRLEKGKYYRPRKTAFGELKPADQEIIQAELKTTEGYITGTSAFNVLGLTTQIANEIVIATDRCKPMKTIGNLRIRFIKTQVEKTKKNFNMLPLLDAIRNIKKIPDCSPDDAIIVIAEKIKKLTSSEQETLSKLALNYNPSTRAITGAILESISNNSSFFQLKKSLNPLSSYQIGISQKVLPNKQNWKIS